jgi:hypothetical protein
VGGNINRRHPPRLAGRDVRAGAEKPVAANARPRSYERIRLASPAHIAKQPIAGAVALLVVDGLQVVHVDQRRHKASADSQWPRRIGQLARSEDRA